ncbi:hypothetical protein A3844_00615 [Paenibacillus helianthi]|uniref:Uncharacterized protein n=1 Tax=Paenibacillus helianthi TaxID=1349432 RepID=A0ABX3EXA4_9BACL|nr:MULTISPECIES: hypothetical protein [Paenibacillus]OKP91664.1 hypothetical protein A3844_00615 [Paenibacillus helianthi]OKP94014.1 hypothetical protein A3848_02970 [Paenibacillus sp. P32E]
MPQEPVTDRNGLTEEQFLQGYDAGMYERPSVTVDMLIFIVMEHSMRLNAFGARWSTLILFLI